VVTSSGFGCAYFTKFISQQLMPLGPNNHSMVQNGKKQFSPIAGYPDVREPVVGTMCRSNILAFALSLGFLSFASATCHSASSTDWTLCSCQKGEGYCFYDPLSDGNCYCGACCLDQRCLCSNCGSAAAGLCYDDVGDFSCHVNHDAYADLHSGKCIDQCQPGFGFDQVCSPDPLTLN